jgi:hypothetical protein
MEIRRITVDAGEDRNWVFSLETLSSAVEIIAQAKKLGYLAVPAGALRQRGDEESRAPRAACIPFSRIVEVS